jgi:hypothetical protein
MQLMGPIDAHFVTISLVNKNSVKRHSGKTKSLFLHLGGNTAAALQFRFSDIATKIGQISNLI